MSKSPFRAGDAFSTFREHLQRTLRHIDGLENQYVLKASLTELEAHYIDEVMISPISLDVDGHYIEEQRPTSIDVSNDFNRAVFPGEQASVKGTLLKIAIPYSGNQFLWDVRPSTHSLSGYPKVEVRDDVIVIEITFADDSVNGERLKAEINRIIGSLRGAIDSLRVDVETHNGSAPAQVISALNNKRSLAATAVGAVASLGIPIKLRGNPSTFNVPTKRRQLSAPKPKVATEPFALEPALDQQEFEHVLTVLKSMSMVIERSPYVFSTLDEEAIRTHFLLQLNGHYEGSATGETFNAAGKTDILIRVRDRNIFIAECKFWRGQSSFESAVDQLLGYLSWRDSKCALLVFNQNKDSSSVRNKMHEVMTSRSEHKKTISHDAAGDSRYVFVKSDDPGRERQIVTMLFDMPKA